MNPTLFNGAEPAFWGQWIIVALGIIGGLGGLATIAGYFATRRELASLERRVSVMETDVKEDRRNNEVHASERSKTLFTAIDKVRDQLNSRLDPVIENTAALKASHESFTTSFNGFTRIMEKLVEEGACRKQ